MNIPEEVRKSTLVDRPRLEVLSQLAELVRAVPGDVAEVGVYKGGTALWLASCMESTKRLLLFDTFRGMPPVDSERDKHKEGDFSDTSEEHVISLLSQPPVAPNLRIYIHKGLFPLDTGREAGSGPFSLVHLDVDIYTSVRDCLAFFHPRMSPGGYIVLDDYLEPNCPGAKAAADEFSKRTGKTVEPTCQSQALIRY